MPSLLSLPASPAAQDLIARLQVDENGKMTGKRDIIALAGFMRQRGEADACLNRLLSDKGLLSFRK